MSETKIEQTEDGRVSSVVYGKPEIYDRELIWRDAQRSFGDKLMDSASFTPAEAQKMGSSYSKLFAHMSFTGGQAGDMFDAVRSAHQSPPTAEQQATWKQDTQAALVQEFGREGAAQALRDAKALLAKSPALSKNVASLKLGDHPRVVMALAERAREAKKHGKL